MDGIIVYCIRILRSSYSFWKTGIQYNLKTDGKSEVNARIGNENEAIYIFDEGNGPAEGVNTVIKARFGLR